ncbi:MAG: flippase [Anaerolineae bacterium]|nr:flippase [Anaerolineae bacterium]
MTLPVSNEAAPPSALRKIVTNMSSLIASDVINRVTSFVIYALVGRYLGAFAFGQMSLALSMFYTFQVFAIAGLKTLITREVAKNPDDSAKLLVHGSVIVVASTLLSLLALLIFMEVMGYNDLRVFFVSFKDLTTDASWFGGWMNQANTGLVILIVCLGLLPFALASICEGIFQGREQMTFIAYVNGPANIVRIVLIFLLTTNGAGLYPIAIIMFVSHIFVMLAEWFFMQRLIGMPPLDFHASYAYYLVRKSLTFLGIDAIIAIMSSMYLVLLVHYINEAAVGLLSSATQLITPLNILYQSIVLSVFPIMCQRFDPQNPSGLKRISSNLLEMLLILAIPMTVGVLFFAEWGLVFVYGKPEFAQAGEAVRLMVFAALMQSVTSVLGRVLVASMRERVTLRIVTINLFLTFVLGVYFIERYGVLGAALASLIATVFDLIQHYIPVAMMFKRISLLQIAWRPTIAAGVMGLFIYVFQGQPELLTIILAVGVYFISLGLVMLLTVGGISRIRLRYLGAST